jgi:hypothetical protein
MIHAKSWTAVALLVLGSCDRTSRLGVASSETSADTIVPPSNPDTLVHGSGDFGVAPVYSPRNPRPAPVASNEPVPPAVASESDSIIFDADDESMSPISDSTVFSCTPKSLRPGDTLTLRMKTPHWQYLSLHAPAETYYLVHPQFRTGKNYSVVSAESFKDMGTLKVAADLQLPPARYGKDTIPEAVFSHPGDYELSMAENGGSDYGPPPFICRVTFTP